MINSIKNELKIMGVNPLLISAGIVVIFALLAVLVGDLLNLSCISFEVFFPFFAAIAVGEWGKIKADDNFDVISAQGKSLFGWVLSRFATVFFTVSLFAALAMAIVAFVRNEMPLWEMLFTYFSPTFFLATLGMLLNLCFAGEHISTLTCDVVWLITMLIRELLRFPWVEYVYLFIRYAGDTNDIWVINKIILFSISFLLWGAVYILCKNP